MKQPVRFVLQCNTTSVQYSLDTAGVVYTCGRVHLVSLCESNQAPFIASQDSIDVSDLYLFFLILKVHNYKRLTPFSISDQAVENLDNLQPSDCIVCFSKNDIYSVSRQIEIRGLECAVIYGSLPPGKIVAFYTEFFTMNHFELHKF